MLIHPTAIINDEPMRSPRLSRPFDDELPDCWLGDDVCVGPYAVIQRDVSIGDGTMIGTGARIFCDVEIGERCLIGAGVEIGRGATIGDDVKVLAGAHICGSTHIGNGSVIGMCVITTDDDDPLNWQEKPRKAVFIGERCQIGAGSILLPGVTIGDDAIVGAGAVVSRDVALGATVMGIPARRTQWEIEAERPWGKA